MAAANTNAAREELDSPCENAEAVTPHDTTTLAVMSRALYVGVGGNVAVLTKGGQTVTFTNVQSGTILPIRVQRVNNTSTTATNMVSLY